MIGAIVAGGLSAYTAPVTNSYESISTVTVGSGGASDVTFNLSGVSGYKHLQIRILGQTNRVTYGIDEMKLQFNSDTTGNYSWHTLVGTGSTVGVNAAASQTSISVGEGSFGTTTGGTFGAGVLDILDYTDTSKYKTVRVLSGVDLNGTIASYGGWVTLNSGAWRNTAAITSIKFAPNNGTIFTQYSSFALYGIKG